MEHIVSSPMEMMLIYIDLKQK